MAALDFPVGPTHGQQYTANSRTWRYDTATTSWTSFNTIITAWRDGTGAPSDSLGANGDYYLDSDTGDVYLKSADVYGVVSNIQGAAGTAGPAWSAVVHESAYASSLTLDASAYDIYNVTLTGNLILDWSNGTDGKVVRIRAIQDATGSRTLTLGSSIRVGTDLTAPTLSIAPGKLDRLAFEYNATAGKFDLVSYIRGF